MGALFRKFQGLVSRRMIGIDPNRAGTIRGGEQREARVLRGPQEVNRHLISQMSNRLL